MSAKAAISAGACGNTARFDRLMGQKTESGLVFLGCAAYRRFVVPLTR